jgi:hypothetical protein
MGYLLVTYDRTTEAIEAATLLEEAGLAEAVLVPRPRTLTAGCGVALRIPWTAATRAVGILLRGARLGSTYVGEPRKGWKPVPLHDLAVESGT